MGHMVHFYVVAGVLAHALPCDASWIVSVYGGAIHTQAADVRVQQPASATDLLFEDVAFESRSPESPMILNWIGPLGR